MLIECNVQLASDFPTGCLCNRKELIELPSAPSLKSFRDIGHDRDSRLTNLIAETKITCKGPFL